MTKMIAQEVFNAQFVDEKNDIKPAGISSFILYLDNRNHSVWLLAGWGVLIISCVVPVRIGYEIISNLISVASTLKDPFEGL
jgi:hypothetical protein